MTRREARIFECLADTLLAPRPPLPPVIETDAAEIFGAWLERFPTTTGWGMRALIVGIELAPRLRGGRPWHTLPPARRLEALDRLSALPYGSLVVDGVRAAAGASYYGDERVASALGYAKPAGVGR